MIISLVDFLAFNDIIMNGLVRVIRVDFDPGTGERDPACLRVVDFRLDQRNTLHMSVYFRSWDLWGGFPANLAGLQLVKEYVAQYLGAEDGRIIAASKGLHIYDHAVEIAATRLGMSDVASMDDFLAWIEKEADV